LSCHIAESSKRRCKTEPFKTIAEKYSPNDISIILFNDESIFTVATHTERQHNDRLYGYARPSTKKKEIVT